MIQRSVHRPAAPEAKAPLCPHCGAGTVRISTSVDIEYDVTFDGSMEELRVVSELLGDAMWDERSSTSCNRCGWKGTLGQLLHNPRRS